MLSYRRGRIALIQERANCNSPLHVCCQDVGKYHVNTCKYVCKHTKKHHGHGMRTFACVVGANCNSPTLYFVHIVNSSMFQIRPRYKFIPYFQLSIMGGRIAHNGRANCSHTQLRQLADFAPTRVLSKR